MNELVCRLALVMPCRTGRAVAGRSPSRLDLLVLALELEAVGLLAGQERRIAGIVDLDLLQHLADDHLDVLVVDAHALQPVDLLDLVDQVAGQRLDPENAQDVVRHAVAVHHQIALEDVVAFLNADVLALRDQVLDRVAASSSVGTTTMRRLVL